MPKSPKNVEFQDGEVNAKVLEELQNEFNTMEILDAVDIIDEIRSGICEPDGTRFDLLKLHGQAHALINGDHTNASGKEGYAIYDLADELEMEISDWADKLQKVADTLQKLTMLAPEDDFFDDEEDEDEED